MDGGRGVRSASSARSCGSTGSMIGWCEATSTSMRRASRSWAATTAMAASTCSAARDHRLARRGEHRDGQVRDSRRSAPRRQRRPARQRHGALPGQSRHQPRARRDDAQAVGRRAAHPATTAAVDLAHRVADDGVRDHTVGPPQLRQCQLHAHQHRLNAVDADHRFAGGAAPAATKSQPAQRNPARYRRPPRRTPVRLRAGAGTCRPIANPGRSRRTPCRPGTTRRGSQRHRAPVVLRPARAARRPPARDRRRRPWRISGAGRGDGPACAPRPPARTSAPAPSSQSASIAASEATRSADLPDTTSVRPPRGAERPIGADRRRRAPARAPRARWCHRTRTTTPRPGAGRSTAGQSVCSATTFSRRLSNGMCGFGRLEVQVGRDRAALHGQHRLDETRDPGRGLEVAQVGLDRADEQRRVDGTTAAENRAERPGLDRIAQRRAGAVRLDIVDLAAATPALA